MTNMVMEFTDTQGIMGMYYARLDGENEDVAKAIGEQYMPRFAGDRLPEGGVETCTALAEKLDTLTGIFGIGMPPKGDKDPFGLRRAAIGVLRIIVENRLSLDLEPIVAKAAELYGSKLTNKSTSRDVVDYVLDGLERWLEVERECGARSLEVDRSLLVPPVGEGTKRAEGANAANGAGVASRAGLASQQAPTAPAGQVSPAGAVVSLKPVPVQEQEEPALSTILQTAATLVPSST